MTSFSVVAFAVFVAVLVLAAVWDLRTLRIPNQLIVIAAFAWLLAPTPEGVIGAVALGGGVLAFALVYERVTGRFALGGGDIKLIFVVGLYLGLGRGLWALLAACLVGIPMGWAWQRMGKGNAFPFGPAISLGALVMLLASPWA